MNRFRTKKKGKEDASAPRQSVDSESSGGPFRMFSKNKKSQDEETKPDVDLTNVLPSSDDFRTSLLMTGLSARFSMLREQDDPTTKVGKASDDSVLFPKRQSKMVDFGLGIAGLHDISEVDSIKSPFRSDSFPCDDGSIMGRGKPTEGNNLFGGRQKIYRIPANNTGVAKNGGMPGRALYDDDVALSAFQKWRLAEREKAEEEGHAEISFDPEPQPEMNRRRETSSTTSSVPSVVARYSTAATSLASRPASSIKDSQSTSPVPSSTGSAPVIERNVTRTRRLYEEGLNRNLHDQQSSALSRMDTISKPRQPFGSMTPDVMSPTASNGAFGDRRPILSKASAPNLRSFASPVASSIAQLSSLENNSKVRSGLDSRPNAGPNPPAGASKSESEEQQATLPSQPARGRIAATMGVFDKLAQNQRESQLPQGRETPVESARSRSSSSLHRKPAEKPGPTPVKTVPEETEAPSFCDDSDDSAMNKVVRSRRAPQLSLERPADDDHPAFRKSALPTPLSFSSKNSGSTSSLSEKRDLSKPTFESPEDSPTLGPNSGLSGMVRAHLRSDSTASSIYGVPSQDAEPTPQKSWRTPYGREASPAPSSSGRRVASRSPSRFATPSHEREKEQDDFARHLADGARRVREKLGFVDAENERPMSSMEANKDLNPPRSNALGVLRTQSSRSSLLERDNRDQSQSRSIKTTPSVGGLSPPRKTSGDASDDFRRGRSTQARDQPADEGAGSGEKEEDVHVGLKAFRQARRELQKMKELETMQRHQAAGFGQERPSMTSRTMSHDNSGPPPAMFNRMPRSESRHGSGSRAPSHAGSRAGSRAPSERDRSGSEASNTGQPQMRPMRMRNGSVQYEEQYVPGSPSGGARPGAGMRPGGPSAARQRSYESGPGQQTSMTPSNDYSRSRNGSLGTTASTPNLQMGAGAPPLPPINPRRKNGLARPGEDDALPSPRMPGGFPGADDASDDEMTMEQRRQKLRRATSEGNSLSGRVRDSSRPPLPLGNGSHGRMPGGMI